MSNNEWRETLSGLCERLSALRVKLIFTAKYAKMNAKAAKKRAK